MSDNRRNSSTSVQSFLTGALVGGAVGVALALLYAPKKGKELREDISSKVGDISTRLSSLLKSAKEAGEDLVNEGMSAGDELVHQAYKKAEGLIDEADRIITDARARVNGS